MELCPAIFASFSEQQKLFIKEFSKKRKILRDKHLKEIKEFNVVKQKKFNELKKKYCSDAIGSLMGMSNNIGD